MQLPFLNYSIDQWIALAIILFVSFPVHELAHAVTADRLGDPTPGSSGRLTINPVAHWDIMGTLVLLLTGGFGWAKPVPINPYVLSRRSPAAVMWVSAAGPLSNFALAALAAIPFRLGLFDLTSGLSAGTLSPAIILLNFIRINLVLMLFNLIPLAPLDGEKVADYFFPPSWARVMDTIRPYGMLILLLLIFIVPYFFGVNIIGMVLNPAISAITRFLTGLPL
jgi:Zn-dependent protease